MQPLRASVSTNLSSPLSSRACSKYSGANVSLRGFGLLLAHRGEVGGIYDKARVTNHGWRSQRNLHTSPLGQGESRQGSGSRSGTSSSIPESTIPSSKAGVQSASDKLFADALLEDADESKAASRSMSRVQQLANQTQHGHENWTGDEDVKDAVLRMLVDKYKPLRSGEIQSADEKMKKGVVPDVGRRNGVDESTASLTEAILTGSSNAWKPPLHPTTGSWANEPLLPSNPSHKPWDTTYSVPWHQEAAIKTGNNQLKKPKLSETEEANQKKDREAVRRQMMAGRLTSAREATLDYKLGIKRGPEEQGVRSARPNPSTVKGWGGYVEDKIEKARKAGLFNNVKGRGRPLARTTEEHNPFIGREEFLMNRIVQRNGAAPARVDLQNELDTAVSTFRSIVRDSWTRRAVGTITSTNSPAALAQLTLADVQEFRDPGWFEKEKSYLEAAVKDVNDTVRRYNGVAPYIVRRGTLTLEFEVKRAYEESTEEILKVIQKQAMPLSSGSRGLSGDSEGGAGGMGTTGAVEPMSLGIGAFVRSLVKRLFSAPQ
ncbi:hypothetical protein BKA70DRAFT_1104057 [Coprinopsis sp. MPI-PUGE-AT-0042]|nr:hypothetical protein BKA70DRAFT_1104057 [Coprinopsis sp. MPI-PUGE-AT-0042]